MQCTFQDVFDINDFYCSKVGKTSDKLVLMIVNIQNLLNYNILQIGRPVRGIIYCIIICFYFIYHTLPGKFK